VLHADATSIRLPGRPFRVVANPPYGISSALLRTLLAPGSSLTVGLSLPRRAFLPPPHVDSAVLVVRHR
jgi:23S rRNA (adenine-N6)-dimethyltransferase